METPRPNRPLAAGEVANRIFRFLRQMDAEAVTLLESGSPTGLRAYGWHARPDLHKPRSEVEWSRRLAHLLIESGVPTELERPYPSQDALPRRKKRRDLYLVLAGQKKMSIEVKGAWSDHWGRNHWRYRSYLLHPLAPGLDPTKTHTVPFDLMKLATLRPPETDYIGQLLIGFESCDDPMDSDIEELVSLAGLSAWTGAHKSWSSPTVSDQRVRCWFWFRTAGDG